MKQKTFPLIGNYHFGWSLVLALVVLFVYGLVTSLTDSIWRLSSGWLLPFGTMAVLVGWCISATRHKPADYLLTGIFVGPIVIIFIQSGFYQNFSRAYLETIRNLFKFYYPESYLSNTGPLFYYLYAALGDLSVYYMEISQWLQNLLYRQGGVNQLSINLVWGSITWVVLFLKGWLLRRKYHAFTAALPAFVLLSAVIGFTRQRTSGLIIALSALLTIMVVIEQLKRENDWEIQRIDFSEELRFDIITVTVPLVIIIMVIAGFLPRLSLENIRSSLFHRQRPAHPDRRSDLPEAFGLEQAPLDPFTSVSQPGMPRSHLIGSGAELEEIMVMEVDIKEVFLPPQVDNHRQPPKYYWFGSAYYIYMGSGWITDEIRTESISANQEIIEKPPPHYQPVAHRITKSDSATSTLYFTGILNAVDENITAAWHESTEEYFTAQLDALEYRVNAFVYNFSEEELHQSDQQPPVFILENYLQLPSELPERVQHLALNISNQAKTPFEKAKAIESFLRQYEYSLDLPEPPQDLDLVDYFLFDLQRGYCDYFASAMVVLARVNGLPARLAVGYATGTYDYNNQVFVVTEANAHAWPEIYIEPFGWIPFEPTSSLAVHNWITEDEETPFELPFVSSEEQRIGAEPIWLEFLGAGILLSLILITGFLLFKLFRRRKNQLSTTVQIEAIYKKMRAHLSNCFFTLQKEHTPREVSLLYTQHLSDIDAHGISLKLSHTVSDNITTIINLYEKGIYTTQKLAPEQVRDARRLFNHMLFQAWLLKMSALVRKT